jgi:hypothetical protein
VLEDRTAPSTLTVTTLDDSGAGSLRDAIAAAAAGDTIAFDDALRGGTIALTGGELAIPGDLTIQGPGADQLTVSSGHHGRVFAVEPGVTARIADLTIADGNVFGAPFQEVFGGGVLNEGTLTLSCRTLSGNSAAPFGYADGGGVANHRGTLTVSGCTLSGNSANYLGGGGIFNYSTLAVRASTLSDNSTTPYGSAPGGGICNDGVLTLSNSTLSGNSAAGAGGGIYTETGGYPGMVLTNVTITANRANTVGVGAHGGGVYVYRFSPYGMVPVLHNTLIAGNFNGPSGSSRDDVYGTVNFASDYNLIGDGTGLTGIADGVRGNLVGSAECPIDPLLGPLQDNGGPTRTHALLAGSPARGGGSTAYASDFDQRGPGFPRVVGGRIDIGAYQSQDDSGQGD